MKKNFVLAITGASGSAYALKTLQVLIQSGYDVHLTMSPAAALVMKTEVGVTVDLENFSAEPLLEGLQETETPLGRIEYHNYRDFMTGIASGSFLTAGMVICPCSMGTLSSVANGLSSNLIHRAADVHLKERRKLILVPRETPLGTIALGNMTKLSEAGAVILPAMPGFYHNPTSIEDLVDFVVSRICDQLGVNHCLSKRWGVEED